MVPLVEIVIVAETEKNGRNCDAPFLNELFTTHRLAWEVPPTKKKHDDDRHHRCVPRPGGGSADGSGGGVREGRLADHAVEPSRRQAPSEDIRGEGAPISTTLSTLWYLGGLTAPV